MINELSIRNRNFSEKTKDNSKSLFNYNDEYDSIEQLSNKLTQLTYKSKKSNNNKKINLKIKIKNPHKLTKNSIRFRNGNGSEFYNVKNCYTNYNKFAPFISTCSSTKEIKKSFNTFLELNQNNILNDINDTFFIPIQQEYNLKRYDSFNLENKIYKLEKKCDSLKNLNEVSEQNSRNYKMENHKYKSFYIEKKFENNNILIEKKDIKISIDYMKKVINKLNEETKNYNINIKKYSNEILKMKNEIINLNTLIPQYINENNNYKGIIILLNKKLKELRKELIQIYEKKFKMGKNLQTLRNSFKK